MIRIGFLGAGLIAQYHAFMLATCSESNQIVAVYDPEPERGEQFADNWDCVARPSRDAVLDACDAVFICTWTSAHLDAVAAAAERGMPVFCEKPLSTDLAGAMEMASIVDQAGVVNQVGLVLRSMPAFLTLREWIGDVEEHGRVMNVVFRDDQYLPTQGMYASTWRGDRTKAGAGALLEHSIHDLDILEWLCGPMTSVSAMSSFFHEIDGIEDSVSVLIRFAGGHTATLTSVWHDVLARPSQRRVEVFCERALLTLEGDFVGPVRRDRDPADDGTDRNEVLDDDETAAWLAGRSITVEPAEDGFLRAIRTDGGAKPSFGDALRAHVLADAVYRSAAAGGAPMDVSTTS